MAKNRPFQKTAHKKALLAFLLILPSLLGIGLFYIIPFFGSLYYVFTQGVHEVHFVGLANIRELLSNSVFLHAIFNTAKFLIVGVPLVLALSLLVSVIEVKDKFTWQRWALLMPMVIPTSSLSISWRGMWGVDGFVNQCRALFGAEPIDFLSENAFALLLALYLLKNVGYISVILTSSIRALPIEYQEGYCLDSNSETGYVRKIVMPQILPTLLFAGIVAVMNYFLLFRDAYMLYADNPPSSIYMLQNFMNNNFYKLNYQRLSTAALLAELVLSALIVVVLFAQKRVKDHVE